MRQTRRYSVPHPFLKWVGGKRQLIEELKGRVYKVGDFGRYHEPFVGGGALFFELARYNKLGRKRAYLSDNNERLIETYLAVKEDVDGIIELLKDHKSRNCEVYFYEVRAKVPDTLVERAARIIYLNKTCYNGLFRENSKGLFNSPWGRYKNPKICDEENLRAVARALRKARIVHQHFEIILQDARPGDFVYFDPPYHPVSKTASFTAYAKGGFGEDSQRLLALVFAELDKRHVKVLLSNSMTDLIKSLYKGFKIDEVYATRAVNSRADRRGKVSEALIRNF